MALVTSIDALRAGEVLRGEAISMRVIQGPATIRNDEGDAVLYILEEDLGIYLPRGKRLEVEEKTTAVAVLCGAPRPSAAPAFEVQPGAAALHRVRLTDVPVQRTGDRWYRELIQS